MTPPIRPITDASYNDVPDIEAWRRQARNAVAALRVNRGDTEAQQALADAQNVLRQHAGVVGALMSAANERDRQSLTETVAAERPGRAQSFAGRALHTLSGGLGDEAAYLLGAASWSPTTGRETMDRYRAGREALYEANPVPARVGDVAGILGLGALTGAALPAVGTRIAGGGTITGNVPAQVNAAIRAGAGIGAAEGALYGLAGEGDIGERAYGAGAGAVTGAIAGAGSVAAINALRRFRAMRLTRQATAGEVLRKEGAQADFYEARRGQIEGAPVPQGMDPAEAAFRDRLRRQNYDPATIERLVESGRAQGRFGGAQAPVVTPRPSGGQQPSTQRTAPPEPGITSSEVDAALVEGRTGLAAQRATPVPEGPVVPPAVVQGTDQRGATQAQLATRQGEIATRWLANEPTEQATVSIRALFANLPAAERETALRAFLGNYAAGRIHPGWVPIINQIRGLP